MKRLVRLRWLIWGALPFLLWWLLKDISLLQVARLLRSLEFWQVLTLIILNLFLPICFSLRWWLILDAFGRKLPYFRLVAYRLAGFAVSFLTPGPQFGGEPLQVYALTRRENIPTSIALASVMLDKTLELLASFTFLAFGFLFIFTGGLLPESMLAQAWLPAGILVLLPVAYLGLLLTGRHPLTAIFDQIRRWGFAPERLQKWIGISRAAESQAANFCRCQPARFGKALAVSLGIWGLVLLESWLSFQFLGLRLEIQQVLLTLVAARIALLLPMPGGVGPVEASQVLAMRWMGFDPAYAIGYMLLARLRDGSLAGLGMLIAFTLTRSQSVGSLSQRVGEEIPLNPGG